MQAGKGELAHAVIILAHVIRSVTSKYRKRTTVMFIHSAIFTHYL